MHKTIVAAMVSCAFFVGGRKVPAQTATLSVPAGFRQVAEVEA